jgi:hypothetical protein
MTVHHHLIRCLGIALLTLISICNTDAVTSCPRHLSRDAAVSDMSPNSSSAGPSVGASLSDQQRTGVTGATGVARSERACGECRRMKVRCMRAGDEPCQRCQHTGVECIITASARKRRAPRSSWTANRTQLDERPSPGRNDGAPTGSDDLRAAKRYATFHGLMRYL